MCCTFGRKQEGAQLKDQEVWEVVVYIFILFPQRENTMNYSQYIVESLSHPEVFML